MTGWFDGPAAADAQGAAFVGALVHHAEEGELADVTPAYTSQGALPDGYRGGVVVGLALPGVTCERRVLRISYEAGDDHVGPVLQSDVTTDLTRSSPPGAYDGPDDDTCLWVSGLSADPETCAVWAAAWFARQLGRPVIRREWDRPASGPGSSAWAGARAAAAVEWHLGRPDRFLDSRGTFGRWRLIRRTPSREVQERP